MISSTSKCMRNDQLFMRNEYDGHGKWNIPLVKKQALNVNNLSLIACFPEMQGNIVTVDYRSSRKVVR